jgi:long-subunit acyl-CoA synthetase (AMP-forming)
MTETATVVSASSEHDILSKSSGSLLPGVKAKLMSLDGKEITAYDTPGELLVQSPSVTLGYLNNEKATDETFVYFDDGRWIRTGDEVLFTKAPSGNEHLVVVDRIKELIKVKVRLSRVP